ncbi:MAG: TRAP transporter large permease [Pseudomonadota bacterium]
MILALSIGLLGLLALSIPVGIVLFLLGFGMDTFFSAFPLIRGLGNLVWSTSNNATLIAIPFFVLLGEILVRSGIATRTYAALDRWVSWLPGGLVHANVATATMFSATSGSSVATAATVATVAMPQAEKLGYDPRLFSGAIAAGGTLGIMIPPSINLIVYGFLTQTSIPQLFLAGLVPGIALALGFMAITAVICLIRPELGGTRRTFPLAEMLRALIQLVPIILLFTIIIGTIYNGWATPTEAAAVGVMGAIVIAALFGGVSIRMFAESLLGTVKITSMIMLVVIGASFLNFTLASAGLGRELQALLDGLGLTPTGLILVVVLIYIVLGFFIETLSLMVVTIPIIVPLVVAQGFDPIWFGILMIVLIEMALITPPVGLNLYVVQGARKSGKMSEVMVGAIPYVIAMLLMVGLLILFPGIALYLPSVLGGG